jgi:hypothetical protein
VKRASVAARVRRGLVGGAERRGRPHVTTYGAHVLFINGAKHEHMRANELLWTAASEDAYAQTNPRSPLSCSLLLWRYPALEFGLAFSKRMGLLALCTKRTDLVFIRNFRFVLQISCHVTPTPQALLRRRQIGVGKKKSMPTLSTYLAFLFFFKKLSHVQILRRLPRVL